MLTTVDLQTGRRPSRPQPSLRLQYQEYLLQRIEAYKNSLPRDAILRLGDEAAEELQSATGGQFVLTEVMMLETVDRIIIKRLGLGSYRRWQNRLLKLRAGQREPTHWGLDPRHPITRVMPRIEKGDRVITVGGSTEPVACFIAAFDIPVTYLAGTLALVEGAEMRVAGESLAGQFQAFVVQLGEWLPPLDPACLVVLDSSTLADLSAGQRRRLINALKAHTVPGGVHLLIPGEASTAPEAYLSHYTDWDRDPMPEENAPSGDGLLVVASNPPPSQQA